MSYSNGGGTLTLPSPTHVHHVDVTSAVRSLRRSLSRSPSKFRLVTKSPSSSPKSPLSPSPLSPPKRAISHSSLFGASNPPHTPSPLAVPFPPSAKLALRSSTRSKVAPPRSSSRTRTSPRSPMKRALNPASDCGNATPASTDSVAGQENSRSNSPTERRSSERRSFERVCRMPTFNLDANGPINHALSRLGGDGASDCNTPGATSSPLKRSDAIMNLDQASLGSPVAKRRSLHGSASFGQDFNVFDHGPSSSPHFEIHDDSNQEYELSTASIGSENIPSFTSMPRRSSSLRKSTLQQRHGEKTSWGRRHAAQMLAAQQAGNAPDMSTTTPIKNRPRLSLDQFMPPMARDSPFSSQGSLPNPSLHLAHQPTHQPHPLSRTMTTSSSSSSIADESPTHLPPHFGEQPRQKLDFSKSLPAGSLRPFALDLSSSDNSSFETPPNYKSVKPNPAAFATTGLISKVNRDPEQLQLHRGAKVMPDTPCKPNHSFNTYPAPLPGSAAKGARHVRHSFGIPSTPLNSHGNSSAHSTFGKGPGIFGSVFSNRGLTRRGSFVSVDGDDMGDSPNGKGDSQSSVEFELPPTPTKQTLAYQQNGSPSIQRSFPASAVGHGTANRLTRTSSKLSLLSSPGYEDAEDSDESMDMNDSPTTAHGRAFLHPSDSLPTLSRTRALRGPSMQSPSPMSKSFTAPFLSVRNPVFAKVSHVAPASPLERIDFLEKLSPRTPQDSMLPPDPSGLSISNAGDGQAVLSGGHDVSMPPPATPTTGRGYFPMIGDRRNSTTPISTYAPADIDESLTSRFEKVEMVGTGEFSRVYRVTQTLPLTQSFFGGSTPSHGAPPSPNPPRVFAVKKSRQPYLGTRDRLRKLQEVDVLKALGHSDHVVHLIDSWEDKNYLYIQTEFCEEGSLDLFLAKVGVKGRLDDFRIFKIMLEICLGLKHIHDSNYIHLDLKPANILITFEGVLKIADFGMATSWPAPQGIDGEGDREYIGPEILMGRYDKPADIFALGMSMIEIAGNVQLPDNGLHWQHLRSGDISDVPSLCWSVDSTMPRDATGTPLGKSDDSMDLGSDDEMNADGSPTMHVRKRNFGGASKSLSHDPANLFGSTRRGELRRAPSFIKNMDHEATLEKMILWMITPDPDARPRIAQLLDTQGMQWVEKRRRAGATVFEGNWGPADDVLADDAEMMDV